MFPDHPLKAYIYAYGLRARLPFSLLKRGVDFLDALNGHSTGTVVAV